MVVIQIVMIKKTIADVMKGRFSAGNLVIHTYNEYL